jgi:quinoprotein glucose dehydrogenase
MSCDTWPAGAWKTVGGANAWSELTWEASQGIVFVPTDLQCFSDGLFTTDST